MNQHKDGMVNNEYTADVNMKRFYYSQHNGNALIWSWSHTGINLDDVLYNLIEFQLENGIMTPNI